jgi:hypothetical protein
MADLTRNILNPSLTIGFAYIRVIRGKAVALALGFV